MAGQINIAGTSGSVQLFGNDTIVTDINIYFPPAGGLLFANGNALEATDGTFSGDVTSTGVVLSGDAPGQGDSKNGSKLDPAGYVVAARATNQSLWLGYTSNSTDVTSRIDSDGNITAASGGAFLGLQANTASSGALQLFDDGDNLGIDMAGTGSAVFTGNIGVGEDTDWALAGVGVRRSDTNWGIICAHDSTQDTASALLIASGTSPTAGNPIRIQVNHNGLGGGVTTDILKIDWNGNATFGSYNSGSGAKINSNGGIFVRRDQDTGGDAFAIYSGGLSSPDKTINFTANGSGIFAGSVQASNITSFKSALTTAVTASTDHATLKAAILSALANL